MDDLPDDLTSVGSHHGNEPPTETGQEVRSPSGPDPDSTSADHAPALFQLVEDADQNRIQIRVHSARTEAPPLEEDALTELGQYRSIEDLRAALRDASIEGSHAVFEDAKAEKVLTDAEVSADHAWIGRPRYERITFVPDEAAVSDYVSGLDQPLA